MKTPSLIDILKEPTEKKASANLPNPDDFLSPEEEQEDPENNFDIFSSDEDYEDPEEEISTDKKELTDEDYRQNASMIVGTVDLLQTLTLPFLYQRSMFTKEERLRLKQLKKSQIEDKETTLSEEDLILLDKYNTFIELKESIPFTDMESKALIDPLSEIMKKYKLHLGPEIMLFTALATVSIPRFLPILTPLEKL